MSLLTLAIVILICVCLAEAIILLKFHTVLALFHDAMRMAKECGWRAVCCKVCRMAVGYMRRLCHMRRQALQKADSLRIAFMPTGGMGDYIISSCLVDEIIACGNIELYVFCEKMGAGRAVYGNRAGVMLRDAAGFWQTRYQYDAALQIEHFVHVLNFDRQRVKQMAPSLYEKLKYITEHWESLYVGVDRQCFRERIQFERCRVLGLDRWSELRMGRAFAVSGRKTGIPMEMDFLERSLALLPEGTPYITVNCGADQMRQGLTQLKTWPVESYERLLPLIRAKRPDILIVQIGDNTCPRISGADMYLLGESLELIKWVLKRAACHIDCEGGLVHLAFQMSVRCVTLFGPTPLHMYAYSCNKNVYSKRCGNCMGLHEEWAYSCYRGCEGAPCMRAISSETVCDACMEILNERKPEKRLRRVGMESWKRRVLKGKVALIQMDMRKAQDILSGSEISATLFAARCGADEKKLLHSMRNMEYRYSVPENLAGEDDSFHYVVAEQEALSREAMREIIRIMRVGALLWLFYDGNAEIYECEAERTEADELENGAGGFEKV